MTTKMTRWSAIPAITPCALNAGATADGGFVVRATLITRMRSSDMTQHPHYRDPRCEYEEQPVAGWLLVLLVLALLALLRLGPR
jgi:hypothetical protein